MTRVRYSSKKGIPIIEMANNVEINITNDDPVKWVMVSTKIRNKSGFTENISDIVDPTKFKRNLKKIIKNKMNKKDLDSINKLFKKYTKDGILSKADSRVLAKEAEKI